ncbi:MAG: shikimate kinase [Oribacterium sp.]
MMRNITMIGMPSSGKSMIGVLLAKRLGMSFLDLDILIQERSGRLLRELIAERGQEGFLKLEGDTACTLHPENTIIAPGGSICYEDWAMAHLRSISRVIYLDISYEELEKRVGDLKSRGVVLPEGYTLRDLYEERRKLYERYADLRIAEEGLSADQVVEQLCDIVKRKR